MPRPSDPPARPQEQLLIDALDREEATRILVTSQGLGQLAVAAAARFPQAAVHCHFLDAYHAEQARRAVAAAGAPANLAVGCAADFPTTEIDLAALPFSAQGEAELTRELIQAAYKRLVAGGRMLVATDNPRDTWLHAEMQKIFATVTRYAASAGAVYAARKQGPLRKLKNFACEFVFRDGPRLIRACSRPGVFSHRQVDPGARQILRAMEVRPGDRVLDIGCGSGVLSLAAALRADGVQVVAVDSAARAVECTRAGAERNGLANVRAELNASGAYAEPGTFDLVLANPPYYAAFQIARLFLLGGRAALRGGGRILVVTKSPAWYAENMPAWFEQVEIEPSKGYHLIRGVRA